MKNKLFNKFNFAIIISTIILFPMILSAQAVTVSLHVDPFPSPYISDWEIDPNLIQFSIRNDSSETISGEIFFTIEKSGSGIIASGNSNIVEIFSGDEQITYTPDLLNTESVEYDRSIEDIIMRTGRLPEGSYLICLSFQDIYGVDLADELCYSFDILYPDPPYLFDPLDGDRLETTPIFQWQPTQSPINYSYKYILNIAEVLSHQTAHEALSQSAFLHHSESNIEQANYTYPLSATPFENGKKYAWQVTVVDDNGYPPSSNDGKSEIWTFVYYENDEEIISNNDPHTIVLAAEGSTSSSENVLDNLSSLSFEEVKAEWERIKAGGEVVFPIPGLGLFDRFSLSNVGVSFDTKNKVIAFRGETERFNEKKAQVLMTLKYDMGLKCAISIKFIHFSFGNAFVTFASRGKYEEIASEFTVIVFANKKHTLESKTLPSGVASFFDTNAVAVEPGMNFYSVVDIDRTPWFERFVSFVGVESNQVILTGYGGPVKNLLTKKEAKDFELSLGAKLPAIISPNFRLWLNSRQFEFKGGVTRALGKKTDTTSTAKDTTVTSSPSDSTKTTLVAEYTPFIELKETIKGSFGDRKEHSFYRELHLEQQMGDSTEANIKVEYGTEDTIMLGTSWLKIHDSKLIFEFEKEKLGMQLEGALTIGDMKVADTLLVGFDKDLTIKDSTKTDTTKTSSSTQSKKKKKKYKFRGKAKMSDDFSLSKLITIMQKVVTDKTSAVKLSIPTDMFDLSDIALGFTGGATTDLFMMAKTELMNSKTDLLLSFAKNEKNERMFTIGIKPESWKLTEAIPLLSNPVLDNLDFSNVGFVITNQDCRISSEDLGYDSHEFYSKFYNSDEYELVLKLGINIISVIPLENMEPDDPLIKLMDHLGMHSKGLLLQGAFGNVFGLMSGKSGGSLDLIKDIYLKAGLPPMQPPGSPAWFKSGELALEITGTPSVGVLGAITVDINGDIITFFVQGKIMKDGAGVALAIVGGMEAEEPWVAPFGIKFLTLNKTVLKVSVNAYGNIGLGFAGDLVIGEKDIQCAVGVAINAYSGVPTNAMFEGSSDAGIGFSDLAIVQSKMVAVASGTTPVPLPVANFPEMDIKKMGLKFAPKSDPDLGVEAGMAIKGELHLSRTPDGEMENFAAIDCNVGVEGIWAKGHLNEFKVGPLVWNNAMIDLQLVPLESHFRLNGEVDILGSMKMIDLAITRDSLAFKTETEIDGLYKTQLTANGAFNFTNPSFEVHGELENDFGEMLEKPLAEGLSTTAKAGILSIQATMVAFEKAEQLQQKKEQAVVELKKELEKVRASAKVIMLDSKSVRDIAYKNLVASKRSKNSTYNSYKRIKARKVKQKAKALNVYRSKLNDYRKKALRYTRVHAVYAGKLAIYNAVPDPDNNPKLVALKNKSEQLWNELQTQKEKLNNLLLFFQKIIDYVDKNGKAPVKILKSEFDSSLDNLVHGKGVDFHIELTLLDEFNEIDLKLSFNNIGEAVKTIVERLLGFDSN